MTWLSEDSTPAIVVGLIVEAILLLALVKTGRRPLAYAMAAVALLVGGIVWIEKHTVTDTKLIRATLDQGVVALEHNDLPGLLAIISTSPAAAPTRASAISVAHQITVESASISGIEIKVNRFNNPPAATAELTGHLTGHVRSGLYPYDHFPPMHIRANFRLENDRWLIESYEEIKRDTLQP